MLCRPVCVYVCVCVCVCVCARAHTHAKGLREFHFVLEFLWTGIHSINRSRRLDAEMTTRGKLLGVHIALWES